MPDSTPRTGEGGLPAHPSSPKVKAKGSSHQHEEEEDPKDEERKVACFPGPRGSLGTLGTYGERSGLQEP